MSAYGDEIWDEEQWEAFLQRSDARYSHYMDLLFAYLNDHPPPAPGDAAGRRAWERRLYLFLREKGFDNDPSLMPPTPEAEDEGEEAPALEDLFLPPDEVVQRYSFRDIPVYGKAFELASRVLEWANSLPGDVKDSSLVQFCSSITQIPSNIAKGHSIGYEQDMIGGNIACAKRGLAAANSALDQLHELKRVAYLDDARYRRFYEQTFEVRNELGLYVQDLRARFNLGID